MLSCDQRPSTWRARRGTVDYAAWCSFFDDPRRRAVSGGFLFVAVAYAGPAVIIVSFVPMLFIAIAYFYLNRRDPNCGASYAWISKLVGPDAMKGAGPPRSP